MSWNNLGPTRGGWNENQRLALERVRVVSCSGSCPLLPCIKRKILCKLIIAQTHKASKNMEFQVNNKSWRLTVPSEFLHSKLILKFCLLVNGV